MNIDFNECELGFVMELCYAGYATHDEVRFP